VDLRDKQYDAVVHLVTAANGAEAFYGAATNGARGETAEEARKLDENTMKVYLGHPRLRIVDNSTDFAGKVDRVLSCVAELIGIAPPSAGSYRRYLVQPPVPTTFPVPTVTIDIEISILQSADPDLELRLLARGQEGQWSYFVQELRMVEGVPLLTEKKLSSKEYRDRKRQVDPETELIQKSSLSFAYENQYFELGTFISPERYKGMALLYLQSACGEPALPPFVPIDREVTTDPRYSSSAIAQVDYSILECRQGSIVNAEALDQSGELGAPTMSLSSLIRPLAPGHSLRNLKGAPRRPSVVPEGLAPRRWRDSQTQFASFRGLENAHAHAARLQVDAPPIGLRRPSVGSDPLLPPSPDWSASLGGPTFPK